MWRLFLFDFGMWMYNAGMEKEIIDKLDEFFFQFRHLVYKKGEIIVRADDNPSGVFYLKKGFVKKYIISKKGVELVVTVFKPITCFPISWVINETPNEYFYEASTELSLWRAPRHEFLEFVKDKPEILSVLLSRVCKEKDRLQTRMTYLMAGTAYSKLVVELIINAKLFGKKHENGEVYVQIPEKELAAEAGMTRETVSREMKLVKDKGLVLFRKNKLVIRDLRALEQELSEGV